MTPSFRIGIVGAGSPLGSELKEALAESSFASAQFVLMDDAEAHGKLDQIGDEPAVVLGLGDGSFDGLDFVFFAGARVQAQRWSRDALRAGSTVLDLTGVLDTEPDVLIHSSWMESQPVEPDLLTRVVVPAHPAALAVAMLVSRLHASGLLRSVAATVLHPASEFGAAALDELHQQTVGLLSFQNVPREVFDAQTAFNQFVDAGESARINLRETEERISRHLAALAPKADISIQLVQAPVFHGLCFSIWVELTEAVSQNAVEQALSGAHIELQAASSESPSSLAAIGQNELLVRFSAHSDGSAHTGNIRRLWLWAACDNLRIAAQNAVDCALDLRRLRPQGQVQ